MHMSKISDARVWYSLLFKSRGRCFLQKKNKMSVVCTMAKAVEKPMLQRFRIAKEPVLQREF